MRLIKGQHRITHKTRSTMSYPLSPTIHRHTEMKFDFAHLKWGGMPMPHQISNQTAILVNFFGALSIRYPRCLNDGLISTHVIYHTNKPIIENFKWLTENFFHGLHTRSF